MPTIAKINPNFQGLILIFNELFLGNFMKQNHSTVLTYSDVSKEQIVEITKKTCFVAALVLVASAPAIASTTGADFKGVYDFISDAATGYLGRAIAIFAGVVGLALGAASGKAMPAIMGVILAIFGTLGPQIVNSLFSSAII